MPRSFLRGSQVDDRTITDADLADDAVLTRAIRDKNVTKPKLAEDVCELLLSTATPIVREKIRSKLPAFTDFEIPEGLTYSDTTTFLTRMKVWRNGALQFMGLTDDGWSVDVIPGSDNGKIQFTCDLERGASITVEIL
jgi:hypothetical protein